MNKWKHKQIPPLEFILDWYDAWLRTDQPGKVEAALEITRDVHNRIGQLPELKKAKEKAEKRRGTTANFQAYIHKSLSKEAQEVWERCMFWADSQSYYQNVEKILLGQTKRMRQELFLFALVSSNYDYSDALRMVAIPKKTLDHWKENDLEFLALIEEIQWHKKNFFEHALVDLVEEGHPSAVLFVNRTINADRGYGEKTEVNHHVTTGVRMDELDLDVDTQRKILEAVRKRKQQQAIEDGSIKVVGEVYPLKEPLAQLVERNG